MHRTDEEAKEAFICFYTEQAATDAMEQIRKIMPHGKQVLHTATMMVRKSIHNIREE